MRMVRTLTLAGLLLTGASLAACGTTPKYAQRPTFEAKPAAPTVAPTPGRRQVGKPYQVNGRWYTPAEDPDYDETGLASWYGAAHHGRRTANGETFDMSLPTAAHKTLPLPSLVEVTNLANGRKATVRLNDRGPFVDGRIIDLSRAAADDLGLLQAGVARVRVRYLGPAPLEADGAVRTARPRAGAAYEVQVGAFAERGNAEKAAQAVRGEIRPVQRDDGLLWRVVVGPLGSEAQAEAARDRAARQGFADARVVGPF